MDVEQELIQIGQELIRTMEEYMDATAPVVPKVTIFKKRVKYAWEESTGAGADGFESEREALNDWKKQGHDLLIRIERA